MAAPGDQPAGELLSGYRDLAFVPKPVSFADLAQKLELLLGIPATPTRPLPSMNCATASMQRDVLAGRPSELEAQSGAVARLAARAGVAAPVHDFIYHALLPLELRA